MQLNRSHRQEVNDLKNKLEKLKVELDEAMLSEKQLKQKLDHQEEVLTHKSEERALANGRCENCSPRRGERAAVQTRTTRMFQCFLNTLGRPASRRKRGAREGSGVVL